jgi:Ca2+/Na+ antiporter
LPCLLFATHFWNMVVFRKTEKNCKFKRNRKEGSVYIVTIHIFAFFSFLESNFALLFFCNLLCLFAPVLLLFVSLFHKDETTMEKNINLNQKNRKKGQQLVIVYAIFVFFFFSIGDILLPFSHPQKIIFLPFSK